MNTRLWLRGLSSLSLLLLLSCGGGGDSSASLSGAASASVGAGGVAIAGASATSDGGASSGTSGISGISGISAASGGTSGTSGTSGTASGDASVSTASNGDGSGVGSGGTGISTADASTSVGAVDGLGSIIVNGVRYNIDSAAVSLSDTTALQIGMTVQVKGSVDASLVNGVASQVTSAADLRGPVSAIDLVGGRFVVMGTTVTVDDGTVWADAAGLAGLASGTTVQVWGLPGSAGVLRATRVEHGAANAAPIVTGTVQQLDSSRGTFVLGSLTVAYGAAGFAGGMDAGTLANGAIVRVRATSQPVLGLLSASLVEGWYPIPTATGAPVQLEGVITSYAALGSFRLAGTAVDASAAQITGGQAASIGNGVTVEVKGSIANGVLVATKLKIRHLPGGGVLPSFTLIGNVGNYVSPASFRVRGQVVNASAPGVVFVNGTAASLANGVSVTVVGTEIVNGALVATQVSFN